MPKRKNKGNRIKIDDTYYIQWDGKCFNLIREIDFEKKNGDKGIREEKTYHNTLKSIVKTILKEKTGKCRNLMEIKNLYERANALIEGIYGTVFENLEEDKGIKKLVINAVKEGIERGEIEI